MTGHKYGKKIHIKSKLLYIALTVMILMTVLMPGSFARALTDESIVSGIEGIISRNMKQYSVPGSVLAIVKDGRILAAKGYGYADVEMKTAPDPDGTAFRIASVSKILTVNAVMQLVEQGKLDLDADINQYLKGFKVPDAFGKPITLRDILTHTSGFDEPADYGFAFNDLNKSIPLADIMRLSMPARIRAPGEVTQYSNYAVSLAGLIVENVSGLHFEEYMRKNIYEPLGMKNSSFVLDDSVMSRLAKCYVLSGGQYRQHPYVQIGVRPSGSMSSTARDMALFMLSQLNNGGVSPILRQETLKQVQTQQFADFPGFEGYCFGYYHTAAGGLEHMGSLNSFNAYLLIVPEKNIGVFWATNRGSDDFMLSASYAIRNLLMKKADADFLQAESNAKVTRDYEGNYIGIRSVQKSLSKIFRLLPGSTSPLAVKAMDKQLRIGTVMYRPIADDVYQSLDQSHDVCFRKDSAGRAVMLTSNGMGFVQEPWYDAPLIGTAVLAFYFLLFTVWFMIRLVRRRKLKGIAGIKDARGGWMTASLGINALAAVSVSAAACNLVDAYATVFPFYLLLALTNMSALGTLYDLAYLAIRAVKRKYGPVCLTGAVVFLFLGIAYLLFLWNWNLIGWRIY